jgi:predicted unusual protein kinase regulating ubiquinone biosynthesis (AarF/ABC1/UbiB family)
MHPSLMRAQFTGSLGRAPEDVFKEFDDTPFAAASLGQVHRARTKKGDLVAVKIQYPAIEDAIRHDFAWFRAVSTPAQATGHLPKSSIDEMETQILAETDYRREAANIDLFAKGLAPLGYVTVPRVYRDLSTDQVLTMSLLPGRHVESVLADRPSQKVRDLIGERLVQLFYFQVLRLRALHADPHPGNYLFEDDGSVGLVDFGCVKRFTPAFIANLSSLFLSGGSTPDARIQALLEERFAMFDTKLRPAARRALMEFGARFYRKVYPPEVEKDDTPFDFGASNVVQDYLRESKKAMQSKATLAEHVFLGLYHTLHRLRARVHTSRIVRALLEGRR